MQTPGEEQSAGWSSEMWDVLSSKTFTQWLGPPLTVLAQLMTH